ncbi:MAG: glycosyltransferase family 9 protein [Candidatus Binatia bacterium]
MKILIVNLTRFGDLLQTSPIIAGLRAQHRGAEVHVLVERNFAEACRGIPGIDRLRELDLDDVGRTLLAEDLRGAYARVERVIAELRAERFDLALNYSSSRMSAVLMHLIGVPDTRGWTMTPQGHRLIAHPWSRLFSAACLVRRQAPFNLVDYYKRAAGVIGGPRRLFYDVSVEARAKVAALLAEAGAGEGTPLVAFQLGASRAVRRWPVESFVALGRELHERLGARLVLCGGGNDRPMAEEIAAGLGPLAIDQCGRTSIAELGALLERCDVLVTPDTGPMHMAVAVGTPVVALFFGPALPFDTGPYAADQVALHAEVPCAPCDHNVTCLEPFCRETLAPAAVAEAVVLRRAGDWAGLEDAARRWPGFAWYRTTFDAAGLADVTRLGGAAPSRAERLRRAYRELWTATLAGDAPPVAGAGLAGEAETVRALVALAETAAARSTRIEAMVGTGDASAVLEAAAVALEECDAALFRFGAAHEPATLLVQQFRFEKENVLGEDLDAVARATRVVHEELAARARMLLDRLAADPAAAGGDDATGA